MAGRPGNPGTRFHAAAFSALAGLAAFLASCAPTLDAARAGPPLRAIVVSAAPDPLLPCMDRLLQAAWAPRGAAIQRAAMPDGSSGELMIGDRDGPALLVEARSYPPHLSSVAMRGLRHRVDPADLDKVATVAEACSS